MKAKILGIFSATALVMSVGAGNAHAGDVFSIGGSFNGFGGYSHSDKGPAKGRAQGFFSELPTVCSASNAALSPLLVGGVVNNCLVNFTNVTPGDSDFGAYEASLSLVGVGTINENAEMVFRIGLHAPGSGDDTAPAATPGEVNVLVEQAYADFHTDDGELGVFMGRLAPNVGTSLHAADRRTPYLSIARAQLLPSILTGAMVYYNSGEFTVSGMIYNDLAGTNNQTDLDLGYALAVAYGSDEMDVRLSWFISPEAPDAAVPGAAAIAQANPDNQMWVNVVNLHAGTTMDDLSAYLDLTWRRDAIASFVHPQAVAIALGAEIKLTEMFSTGLDLEWAHGNSASLLIPTGALSGTLGVTDEDTTVVNPYIAVNLAKNTGVQIGYNWEHTAVNVPGDNNRNYHTLYGQVTAVLDSGAEPRSPTIHPLN